MPTRKAKTEPVYEDAGVYAIVSRKSGAMYVGASCRLMGRLNQHRSMILNQTFNHVTDAYRQAFADHAEADIEFRILERVEVIECDWTSRRNLLDREGHWIRTLKPSVNSPRFHRPRLGHEIPIVDLSKQSA